MKKNFLKEQFEFDYEMTRRMKLKFMTDEIYESITFLDTNKKIRIMRLMNKYDRDANIGALDFAEFISEFDESEIEKLYEILILGDFNYINSSDEDFIEFLTNNKYRFNDKIDYEL